MFLFTNWESAFLVISENAFSNGVLSCNATGWPTSPASLMLWTKGTSPKNAVSISSAKFLAPSFPKM